MCWLLGKGWVWYVLGEGVGVVVGEGVGVVVGEGVSVVCAGCCAVFAETEGVGLTSRFSH